jgi:hypothetical protein
MLLMLGGCPKRQTTSRIVYVPSPPAAQPSEASASSGNIVISEPAPPQEPVVAQPPEEEEAPPPKPERRRRRPVRTEPAETTAPEGSESPEQPAADITPPPLETRDDPAIRGEVQTLQADIQRRVEEMGRQELSKQEQKTFEDARQFLEQSQRALDQGDSQRALMLARKASLLISALRR